MDEDPKPENPPAPPDDAARARALAERIRASLAKPVAPRTGTGTPPEGAESRFRNRPFAPDPRWPEQVALDLGLPELDQDSSLLDLILDAERPNVRAIDMNMTLAKVARRPVPFTLPGRAPTVGEVDAWLTDRKDQAEMDPLVHRIRAGQGPRLLVMPTAHGVTYPVLRMLRLLPGDHEILALRFPLESSGAIPVPGPEVLLDSWTRWLLDQPPRPTVMVGFSAAGIWGYNLGGRLARARPNLPMPAQLLLDAGVPDSRIDLFAKGPWLEALKKGDLPRSDPGEGSLERISTGASSLPQRMFVTRAKYFALRRKLPRHLYPGPMHILRGRTDPAGWLRDPKLWELMAGRPIPCTEVDAPHVELLDPPWIDRVLPCVAEALERLGNAPAVRFADFTKGKRRPRPA